eukprot:1621278-Amphidinium_carterae.1
MSQHVVNRFDLWRGHTGWKLQELRAGLYRWSATFPGRACLLAEYHPNVFDYRPVENIFASIHRQLLHGLICELDKLGRAFHEKGLLRVLPVVSELDLFLT